MLHRKLHEVAATRKRPVSSQRAQNPQPDLARW